MKLTNETAIITGSTTGIGRALAELLLQEGCKVTICSRNKEKVQATLTELKQKYGESVIGFPCDVSNPEELQQLVKNTVKAFGSVRILIANAGINTIYGPFRCMSPEMVKMNAEKIFNVNLIGVMNSIASVLPEMMKQGYGRIITLSGAGADRPIDNMTIYTASKGGIVAFSKSLALELSQIGTDIKLNIFQPGMLRTNLTTTVECVPNWLDEKDIEKDVNIVLDYIGGDINKSTKKVLPYISPKCKDSGKLFRGFSVFKIIIGAIKMQRYMKQTKKEN